MSSIVHELQRDALDQSVSVSSLLRKAFVVARKLQIEDLKELISNELNGYGNDSDFPDYRLLKGEVKAWNNVRNEWQPIFYENSTTADNLSKMPCNQTVAELETIMAEDKGDKLLGMKFSYDIESKFREAIGSDREIILQVSKSSICNILNSVRNIILDWALKLEEAGILGEQLSFSADERKAATGIIFNIGSMTHSQIQQGSTQSVQLMDNQVDLYQLQEIIKQILSHLPEINLNSYRQEELLADIKAIQSQISSPNPKHSVIKELLQSARKILESAAGGTIAHGIISQITSLLG